MYTEYKIPKTAVRRSDNPICAGDRVDLDPVFQWNCQHLSRPSRT